MAAMIEQAGNQSYTIQVAQDRSGDERFIKEFATLLIVVLGFGSVVSNRACSYPDCEKGNASTSRK
jgi:hypothetical protein